MRHQRVSVHHKGSAPVSWRFQLAALSFLPPQAAPPDTRGPSSWSLGPANPSYSAPMLPPAREDVGDFSILGGYTSPHAVDVVL